MAKDGVWRDGRDLPRPLNHFSPPWRACLATREAFFENIRFKVRSGVKIFFWVDKWIGNRSLAIQFPDLFHCASNQRATLSFCLSEVENQVVLVPILEGVLKRQNSYIFSTFLELWIIYIPNEGFNRRIWGEGNGRKIFSDIFLLCKYQMMASHPLLSFLWLTFGTIRLLHKSSVWLVGLP